MTENIVLINVQACFVSMCSGQTRRAPVSMCALLYPGSREGQRRLGPHSPLPELALFMASGMGSEPWTALPLNLGLSCFYSF